MKPFWRILLIAWLLPYCQPVLAQQSGYEIKVSIKGYEGEKIFLGYRRADKVYSRDTAQLMNGSFVFTGDEPLSAGIYLILMPPDNKYFEILVAKDEQRFFIETLAPDFYKNLKFKGSLNNQLQYEYQTYIGTQIELSKQLNSSLTSAISEEEKETYKQQLEELNKRVRKYQNELIAKHSKTFVSKLIRAFQEPEIPPIPENTNGMTGDEWRFNYYRSHYFDNFDFGEEGFLNTPYLREKVEKFVNDLTVQVPDSVISAVDLILEKAVANKEVFRWTLSHLLNKYYVPEIMGLDAVFVHLSNKYYATGKADWVTSENLKKITDDAYMMQHVLLGNKAPEINVQLYDPAKDNFTDNLINLYDVNADYTVVFLWKPGCGHCQTMSDELKKFYLEWKTKGVEIFSISSASYSELPEALKDIHEKKMPWIITADPYLRARALIKYYGTSLPKLYLLDKDKKIIANRIGVSQLAELIENDRKTANEKP
jgi:thiol-disulfide isomerase/thioredoxin